MLTRSVMRRIAVIALAVAMAAAMVGCSTVTNAVSGIFGNSGEDDTESQYIEEQVKIRDITNYYSFTGNITPVSEVEIVPEITGVKVTELYISEGDEVQEGDVLMVLDDTSIQQSIDEMEISMNTSATSSALSLKQAQMTYDNYVQDLADGLNSTLNSAESSLDSAYANLVSAQQSFNNEVSLNNQEMSSTVMSAKNNVDSAYLQLESAYLSLQQAYENQEFYVEHFDSSDYTATGTYTYPTFTEDEDGNVTVTETTESYTYIDYDSANEAYDQQMLSYEHTIESAEMQVESAQLSYNQAVQSYQAALINEDNSLTSLYNSLITAQTNYLTAIDSYNQAVRSISQQIETYLLNIEVAEANANQDSSEYQLQLLYDQLDDCTVTATASGVITELNVSVGSIVDSSDASVVITDSDEMEIEISINEYDITAVEVGNPVTITIEATGNEYEGSISSISQAATASSGVSYFTAKVQFEGDDDAKSGMSAEIKMTTSEALEATSVSSVCIQTAADGSSYVLTYDSDGNVQQTTVTTGVTDGTYVEITDGLYPGDTVLYTSAMAAAAASDDDDSSESDMMGNMGGGNMGGGDMGGGGGGGGGGGAPGGF